MKNRTIICLLLSALCCTTAFGQSQVQDFEIQGACGKLVGRISLPQTVSDKYPTAILCHGLTGTMDQQVLVALSDSLLQRGVATVAFDFNGHGKSEGRLVDMSLDNELEDFNKVFDFVMAQSWVDRGNVSIAGHSQGGMICSVAAGEKGCGKIRSVLLLAPAACIHTTMKGGNFFGSTFDPENIPDSLQFWGGPYAGKEYIKSALETDALESISKYQGPVMVIQGSLDAKELIADAKKYPDYAVDCKYEFLDGFGHVFKEDLSVPASSGAEFICSHVYSDSKPFTIPEIREWTAVQGRLIFPKRVKVVYPAGNAEFKIAAEVIARNIRCASDLRAKAKAGVKARRGNIEIVYGEKADEAYGIEISDHVTITASTKRGAIWAGSTILQIAERTDDFSLPCGTIEDWPEYGIRGFMMDTGRKFIPFQDMMDYIRNMSYYKMNTFQIHLNESAMVYTFDGWERKSGSFRLESEVFPGLASRDGFYTKKEFLAMEALADSLGVEIIPEIDIPAHSSAFSQYRKGLGLPGDDYHLDLFKQEVYDFLDSLYTEFIAGPNPVFTGHKVSIGTDEYSNATVELREQFRYFTNHYLNLVADLGKQPCMWGSLSHAWGDTPVRSEGVLMNAWYNGYADPDLMIEQGYDLISINDEQVYIVPAVDYYQDYLNCEFIYNEWTPAHVGTRVYEENHPNIKGGMFAVWNDHACNGISIGDIEYRTQPAIQAISAKCWSGVHAERPYSVHEAQRLELSDAPGLMMAGRNKDSQRQILSLDNVRPGMKTGVKQIGYHYTVSFDVEVAEDEALGAVLFDSGSAKFYLKDPMSGMIGFSRDGYLYRFNFAFYPGEKAHVTVKGDQDSTSLYVNGQLVETLKRKSREYVDFRGNPGVQKFMQTLVFPLEEAGSFKSKVSNLTVVNE